MTCFVVHLLVSLLIIFFSGRTPYATNQGITSPNSAADTKPLLDSDTLMTTYSTTFSSRENQSPHNSENGQATFYIEDPPPNLYSEFPFQQRSIKQVVKRLNFFFLSVQFVLMAISQTTFQSNINTYLRSFSIPQYNLLFTVLNTTLQATTKFLAGIVSDVIAKNGKWPRTVVYLGPYAFQTLMFFICIFVGDNFSTLLLTTIACGISFGATWCQTPIILGELFGDQYMGSNYGWAMVSSAVFSKFQFKSRLLFIYFCLLLLGFLFTFGFSAAYEQAIFQPGEIYCYGLQCFTWSFVMLAGASLVGFIATVFLTLGMLENKTQRLVVLSKFSK